MTSKSTTLVIEDFQFFFKSNYVFESWFMNFLYFIKVRLFRQPWISDKSEILSLHPLRKEFTDWLKHLDSKNFTIQLGMDFPDDLSDMLRDKYPFLKQYVKRDERENFIFLRGNIHNPTLFTLDHSGTEIPLDCNQLPFSMIAHKPSTMFHQLKCLVKTLRCQQYIKNILIFIPLIASHHVSDISKILTTLLAFLAFSFAASAVYILNDLSDLQDDRKHPTKKLRPLASGDISIQASLWLIPILLGVSAFLCVLVNSYFILLLLGYFIINLSYTLYFKKIPIFDIVLLSNMYTYRLIVGSEAVNISLSFWLLGFSFFLFLSLAVIKRYKELFYLRVKAVNDKSENNRRYRVVDMPILLNLGMTSGLLSVLVFSLYINSPDILVHYTYPVYLWGVCPFFLLWIASLWLATVRNEMTDDPIIYALTNRKSLLLITICGAILMKAA